MTTGDEKRMRLRYAGVCRMCGTELPASAHAVYERSTRAVRCLEHPDGEPEAAQDGEPEAPPEVDPGVAGASARREFEKRRDAREQRIRTRHPKLGGLILAVSDDPQTTRAWDTGALGEERLGARLTEMSDETLRVLHDRRVPRSRANIDHLAVTPSGVWVIDAKRYRGRPQLKVEGGVLRPRIERLLVGTRDQTKLVESMHRQMEVVVTAMGDPEAPVRGVLCFVEADWPLIGGPFSVRDVLISAPKKMYPRLRAEGPLMPEQIDDLHRRLALALPPA